MGDISEHFDRREFVCKCGCGKDTVDAELITVLERARDYFGTGVTITSGNRCSDYNEEVGGFPGSRHLTSKAADILVTGVSPAAVSEFLRYEYPDRYGIGTANNFTHIDVREGKSRWRY